VLEVILTALVISAGIALAAAGITIIYMSTETFNFAHASFTTIGFFVVYNMLLVFGGSPYYYFIFAALFTGLVGVAVYLTVNRWLIQRGADMVTLMMSTLGVDLILFGLINQWADIIRDTIPGSSPRNFLLRTIDYPVAEIAGTTIYARVPISIGRPIDDRDRLSTGRCKVYSPALRRVYSGRPIQRLRKPARRIPHRA